MPLVEGTGQADSRLERAELALPSNLLSQFAQSTAREFTAGFCPETFPDRVFVSPGFPIVNA